VNLPTVYVTKSLVLVYILMAVAHISCDWTEAKLRKLYRNGIRIVCRCDT